MNVIVTGATGFIGSALCAELVRKGHQITAIVRPDSVKKSNLPKQVRSVFLSLDQLHKFVEKNDVFYHLAWNGAAGNDRNCFEIQQSNILYTVEAIRTAKRCGCYKFIGAGSQAEYGIVHERCTEETLPNPFMMYGAAKLSSYYMGKIVAEQEKISFVWPRIYSVYGPGQNEGTLISYLVSSLLSGETPQLSDCQNIWDFIYISDCTAALRLLGEKKETEGIYNISSGKPRALRRFVEEVREIIAPHIGLDFGAHKSGEQKTFHLNPDVSKMKKLGFQDAVSFSDGIKRILQRKVQ